MHKDIFWNVRKACVTPLRKDRYRTVLGIASVLVMLAVVLAPAHTGDAEPLAVNLGLPLPAFGTVMYVPSESECKAPAVLPNLTFAESHMEITPVATIRHGGDFVLVTPVAIAVHDAGDRAYALVAANRAHALQIINITDPASPSAVVTIPHGGDFVLPNVLEVAVYETGGRAYALVKSGGGTIFQIIDITDPSSPSVTETIRRGGDFKINGVGNTIIHETGGRAYALVTADSVYGIQFVDITDPASPSAVLTVGDGVDFHGNVWGIAIHETGDHTYALATISDDDAIQITDITDPANPSAVTTVRDGGDFELDYPVYIAIHEAGGRAYALVASFYDDAIQIIDITDPVRPTAAATVRDGGDFELDSPVHIAIHEAGGRAYAIIAASDDDAVQIIDITDPVRPAAAVTIRDGGDFELYDSRNIVIYENNGITYVLVSSHGCNAVQIIQIDAGTSVTTSVEKSSATDATGTSVTTSVEKSGATDATGTSVTTSVEKSGAIDAAVGLAIALGAASLLTYLVARRFRKWNAKRL